MANSYKGKVTLVGRTPNKTTKGEGSERLATTCQSAANTDFQKGVWEGQDQNMCKTVAGGWWQQIHVGSNLANLHPVRWVLWTSLHWITPCLAQTEEPRTTPQVGSPIAPHVSCDQTAFKVTDTRDCSAKVVIKHRDAPLRRSENWHGGQKGNLCIDYPIVKLKIGIGIGFL